MLLTGCNSWLDVKPYDKIGEGELFKTEEGFQKLLNGIYIELNSKELYGATLGVEMIEILGGAYDIGTDANVWGNYPDLRKYNYGTDFWRSSFSKTWDKAYALILNCNKLIENMETRRGIFTGDNYNIIRGETLALRAMLHFDMLRLFGPVYSRNPEQISIPYYTSEVLSPNPLLPASEVAALVIADLESARSLLINDPVITEGTLMNSSSGGGSDFLRYRALRFNYYAITGLLARVNLYVGSKPAALECANEVIRASNSGIFPFVDRNLVIGSPEDPDRIFTSEVLFALSHNNRNSLFLDYFSPSRTTFTFRMESALIGQVIFGGGIVTGGYQDDYRNRVQWSTSGTNKYFYKYTDMVQSGKVQNTMIPMLRLGEMYLIAAESQSDDLSFGTSYVNILRKNRGISTNLPLLTPELLQYEYIRELYGEGQLFFLYKRLYTKIIRSADNNKNVAPSDNIFVVPMPDSEMDNRD